MPRFLWRNVVRWVTRGTCQAPREVVTDKLSDYIQPCAAILPNSETTRGKGANNLAETHASPLASASAA